ncbi:MAG: ParA family protein [Panacagrimonas sp.]
MTLRVVFNQKGGVGKTTIVCNLAAVAAARGRRTLVIDLDTQANATQYLLGSGPRKPRKNIADFFESTLSFSLQSPSFSSYVTGTPFDRLDVISADPRLEELIVKLESKQKIYKLRDALRKLRGYDEVFIDTPPALNFYSRSALIACQRVLVPFDCDEFSRQALYTLLENLAEIREDHNPALLTEGIIVNQFQPRAKLPARVVEELTAEGHPLLSETLAPSVKVKESHEQHLPIIHFEPKHRVAKDFLALADRLGIK